MNFKQFDDALEAFYDMMIYHRKDIKTKWSLGSYDGPAAGLVEYNDKMYLAYSPLDHEFSPRVFLIIDIGDDRINSLLEYCVKRHNVFGNCKYNDDGKEDTSSYINHMTEEFQEIAKEFKRKNKMPSYFPEQDDKIVGWFRNWRNWV